MLEEEGSVIIVGNQQEQGIIKMKVIKEQIKEIRRLRALGNSYKEIAKELGISITAVQYHASDENRKRRNEQSKRYFKALPDWRKKEIYKKRGSYILSYIKKRYHSDKIYRERIKKRAREYYRKNKKPGLNLPNRTKQCSTTPYHTVPIRK